MGWSIKLFSLGGTAVRMHLTFLLLIAWIAASEWMRGTPQDAVYGVGFILVLFGCVVLHEFGHIWAARRYGIRTPDVTLLPIGGVASMERMPEKPTQETVVALAGPAVNFLIAAVLFAVLGLRFDPEQMSFEGLQAGFWAQVAIANVVLLVFNLIPAFPMDGGRVLRALLAIWLGFGPATKVAARIGQALAIVLAFVGIWGNPLLVLIAVFIFMAAGGEAGYVKVREATRGHVAAEAMIRSFQTLGVMATVDDAAGLPVRTAQNEFPVVDGAGRLRGVVTRKVITDALAAQGGARPVLEVMASDVPTLAEDAPLESAVALLRRARSGAVGIVDATGRFVSYVTPASIRDLVAVRQQTAKRAPSQAR
jgi:Zn-dependent protease/CBS domain-containing protein